MIHTAFHKSACLMDSGLNIDNLWHLGSFSSCRQHRVNRCLINL
jgi:hypothetical protein